MTIGHVRLASSIDQLDLQPAPKRWRVAPIISITNQVQELSYGKTVDKVKMMTDLFIADHSSKSDSSIESMFRAAEMLKKNPYQGLRTVFDRLMNTGKTQRIFSLLDRIRRHPSFERRFEILTDSVILTKKWHEIEDLATRTANSASARDFLLANNLRMSTHRKSSLRFAENREYHAAIEIAKTLEQFPFVPWNRTYHDIAQFLLRNETTEKAYEIAEAIPDTNTKTAFFTVVAEIKAASGEYLEAFAIAKKFADSPKFTSILEDIGQSISWSLKTQEDCDNAYAAAKAIEDPFVKDHVLSAICGATEAWSPRNYEKALVWAIGIADQNLKDDALGTISCAMIYGIKDQSEEFYNKIFQITDLMISPQERNIVYSYMVQSLCGQLVTEECCDRVIHIINMISFSGIKRDLLHSVAQRLIAAGDYIGVPYKERTLIYICRQQLLAGNVYHEVISSASWIMNQDVRDDIYTQLSLKKVHAAQKIISLITDPNLRHRLRHKLGLVK